VPRGIGFEHAAGGYNGLQFALGQEQFAQACGCVVSREHALGTMTPAAHLAQVVDEPFEKQQSVARVFSL